MVMADASGAGILNSYGIRAIYTAQKFDIRDNVIWDVRKHQPSTPVACGIGWASQYPTDIIRNRIINATGATDDGSCAAGIWVGGTISTAPGTTVQNVNVENNTVDNVINATNGIYFGGILDGNEISNCIIANNSCIRANCHITGGSVLGDNVTVVSGCKLDPGSRIWPGTIVGADTNV